MIRLPGTVAPLVPLLALLLTAALPARAEPPSAELLRALAAHDERMETAFHSGAMTVTTHTEELDRKGKVESVTDVRTRISHDDKGDRRAKVLTATKDGKDVVAEKQAEADKQHQSGGQAGQRFGLAASPFAEVSQPKYRFDLLGPDPKDPQLVRIRFKPLEPNSDVSAGEAVVDPKAGELVHVSAHPSETPHFVDTARFELSYGATTAVGRTLSRMDLEAEGGFLFIHKHVIGRVEFSDFEFPAPRPAPAPAAAP